MVKFHKYLDIGFLLALLIIPFLSPFGRIDIIGPQYLYLSLLLFIYLASKLLFIKKVELQLNYSSFFYLLFLIMAFLSSFNSFNISESIIDFTKYATTFFILVLVFSILNNNKSYVDNVILVLTGFLFVETFYILYIFIENYSFDLPPSRLREFQGLAYNQNIASLSILSKIPLAIYLFIKVKRTKIRFVLGIILAISVFDILIIGSRSAIYGIYIYIFLLLGLLFFVKYNTSLQISRKKLYITIVIIGSVFILQNILYTNSTANLKAVDRTLQLDDYSTNYRLKLWESSIEMIKDFPLLGVGIGNWKILSLKYANNEIRQYEVPKHAHNDFLLIMAETGILGGLFFLLFLLSPLYFALKNYGNISPKEKLLSIFLIFSLISVGIDSFFNFPRVRPYSLINLFWVISLIYILKPNKTNRSSNFFLFPLILIFSLFAIYIFNRFNNSLKEQVPLYIEYNQFPDKIITPVKDILLFEDDFPNISNVLIPMKIAKARYLFLEGEYDKAKRLIEEGRKHNPYLGFGDLLMQRIHLAQNKLDSAVFYGKRSIEKLPKNESHYTFYQITQEKVRDLDEIERVFLQGYSLESEAIWQNYLISIANIKLERGIDFTRDEQEYLNQALELYPNNKIIQIADKIINYGGGLILIANDYDSKAIKNYNEKKYQKAIDYWIKATEIIPNDEAYYLNIAHSYISIDEIEKAEKYFDLIETKKLKGISGKFEFLKSISNLKLNRTIIACNYAKVSRDLGFPDAQKILDQYQCYN